MRAPDRWRRVPLKVCDAVLLIEVRPPWVEGESYLRLAVSLAPADGSRRERWERYPRRRWRAVLSNGLLCIAGAAIPPQPCDALSQHSDVGPAAAPEVAPAPLQQFEHARRTPARTSSVTATSGQRLTAQLRGEAPSAAAGCCAAERVVTWPEVGSAVSGSWCHSGEDAVAVSIRNEMGISWLDLARSSTATSSVADAGRFAMACWSQSDSQVTRHPS